MGKIVKNGITYGGKNTSANNISYDNTSTELQSQTVQNAITELSDRIVSLTQMEYEALPAAKKYDGTLYLITDSSADINVGIEDVVLWENNGISQPAAITLSQPYTDFNDIYFYEKGGAKHDRNEIHYLSENLAIGDEIYTPVTAASYSWWTITSSTLLTYAGGSNNETRMLKIIGRRYQKAKPQDSHNYSETLLFDNTTNYVYDTTITMSDSPLNYDQLLFVAASYDYRDADEVYNIFLPSAWRQGVGVCYRWSSDYDWGYWRTTDPKELNLGNKSAGRLKYIIGIKYGG